MISLSREFRPLVPVAFSPGRGHVCECEEAKSRCQEDTDDLSEPAGPFERSRSGNYKGD